MKMSDVLLVTGAGQISLAITRRIGYGKKIIVGDKKQENIDQFVKVLTEAGFDAVGFEMDMSSKKSILSFLEKAQSFGEISQFINGAGVSPSQATIEQILQIDLVGTAILLDEIGKVIKPNGSGITISSQSSHRMEQLDSDLDRRLATTSPDDLLKIPELQVSQIKDSLHAYQLAKRCNEKRVMYEAVRWGKKSARINSISPGIIVTPLAIDEFNGVRGDFYKEMFEKSPAKRPGTADEVANIAELLLSDRGAFITGSDFLIDGGATAAYFYGE